MAEPCTCDPWAGGLISHGRHEQLEELQRRFDVLAQGDFGFSVEVEIPGADPVWRDRLKQIGQRFAAEQVALAVEELTR